MTSDQKFTSLKGHVLIAMPDMDDSRFRKTVIYICDHTPKGTMGIVVNRPLTSLSFVDLLQQVDILEEENALLLPSAASGISIHKGGPVETGRGFVLHSNDYHLDDLTVRIDDEVSLTETLEILKALACGEGPKKAFIALGYAGWTDGQLEGEILRNGWLHGPSTPEIIFGEDLEAKYDAALAEIGVDPALLSSSAGHA